MVKSQNTLEPQKGEIASKDKKILGLCFFRRTERSPFGRTKNKKMGKPKEVNVKKQAILKS
jgi:hypothetical protein